MVASGSADELVEEEDAADARERAHRVIEAQAVLDEHEARLRVGRSLQEELLGDVVADEGTACRDREFLDFHVRVEVEELSARALLARACRLGSRGKLVARCRNAPLVRQETSRRLTPYSRSSRSSTTGDVH